MDDFERQLKSALGREDPPAWLEAKVLAAARDSGVRRAPWRRLAMSWRLRWATAGLAGAAVVASGAAWQYERSVRDRAAGEAAKARLELALKITRVKLQKIERKLNEMERAD